MLRRIILKSVQVIKQQTLFKLSNKTLPMASADVTERVVTSDLIEDKIASPEKATEKRALEGNHEETIEPDTKKAKGENPEVYVPFKKKKMVLFLVYSGKDYMGMQRNPGVRTIESDLNGALLKAGVVNEEHVAAPGAKMHFQRAARTDKGVSAAGQLCSLNMFVDVDNPKEKINSYLVDQIRVIGIQKVTKKFDSKNAADARTYMYMMPTFAFTPYQKYVLDNFKITDEIHKKVNETLALFKGTHNFHNFTSGKKPTDPSARRYIIDFSMGTPFDKGGVEFAVITVKGQSFMLHQIRKMIGLTIAIVRGLTDKSAVDRAYSNNKCDVPKAPGLGLVLDRVHYDNYNKRFGRDGFHEPILWEKYEKEINEFKDKFIYPTIVDTEREERSMFKWLSTLHLHDFEEFLDPANNYARTGMCKAAIAVKNQNKQEKQTSESPEAEQMPAPDTTDSRLKPTEDQNTLKTDGETTISNEEPVSESPSDKGSATSTAQTDHGQSECSPDEPEQKDSSSETTEAAKNS